MYNTSHRQGTVACLCLCVCVCVLCVCVCDTPDVGRFPSSLVYCRGGGQGIQCPENSRTSGKPAETLTLRQTDGRATNARPSCLPRQGNRVVSLKATVSSLSRQPRVASCLSRQPSSPSPSLSMFETVMPATFLSCGGEGGVLGSPWDDGILGCDGTCLCRSQYSSLRT